MIGNSDDETNFVHKLLLTNRQVVNFCQAFATNSPVNIKLSRAHLSKVKKLGGFLGRLFGSLLKTRLLLMKNVIKADAVAVYPNGIPLG